MAQVRKRRQGITRITSKHQATIPVAVLRKAGLRSGDTVEVRAEGRHRVTLVGLADPADRHAGTLRYPKNYLRDLRAEWRV